jgi:hypothetical protein
MKLQAVDDGTLSSGLGGSQAKVSCQQSRVRPWPGLRLVDCLMDDLGFPLWSNRSSSDIIGLEQDRSLCTKSLDQKA